MVRNKTGAIVIVLFLFLAGCTALPSPTPPAPPNTPVLPTSAKQQVAPSPSAAAAPAAKPTAPPAAISSPAPKPAATPAAAAEASLQWFGQSTFLLTTATGTKILIDPFGAQVGYAVPTLQGVDAVVVSHEHGDHNNVAMAGEGATVIRGLANNDWATIDQTVRASGSGPWAPSMKAREARSAARTLSLSSRWTG